MKRVIIVNNLNNEIFTCPSVRALFATTTTPIPICCLIDNNLINYLIYLITGHLLFEENLMHLKNFINPLFKAKH